MNIREITYKQFGRCLKADNGKIELVIPLEFGIRILRAGLIDGKNLFAELPDAQVEIDGKTWHFYGGHRLWLSPETKKTYFPDNEPITYKAEDNTLTLTQAEDSWAGVVKEIEITMSGENLKVVHKVTNQNPRTENLALWAISVMAPGGIEVIPFTGGETGWLHNRQLSIWPYTKMNDPRINWYGHSITLIQQPWAMNPVKLGLSNHEGWGVYVNEGTTFLKRYIPVQGAEYPDNNVWYETYTNDAMLELETLSPITPTKPGESMKHIEEWSIFQTGEVDLSGNDSVEEFLTKIRKRFE